MMSEKVLADLENNIPYDYCRSCDSEDGLYHEYIDEDSWQYKVKMLLEETMKCLKETQKQLQQKENIIKEVREYIENDMKLKDNFMIDEDGAKYLLEILDKID